MLKNIYKSLMILSAMCSVNLVADEGWIGTSSGVVIERLYLQSDTINLYIADQAQIPGCLEGRISIVVPRGRPDFTEDYSAILAAFAAGQKISIRGDTDTCTANTSGNTALSIYK